jgi:hypothetical protein
MEKPSALFIPNLNADSVTQPRLDLALIFPVLARSYPG